MKRRSNAARAPLTFAGAPASAACRSEALGAISTVPPRAAAADAPLGRGGVARDCAAIQTRSPAKATAMRPPVSCSTCSRSRGEPGSFGISPMAARRADAWRVSKSNTADAPAGMKAKGSTPAGGRGRGRGVRSLASSPRSSSTSTAAATTASSGTAIASARLRLVFIQGIVPNP